MVTPNQMTSLETRDPDVVSDGDIDYEVNAYL